MRGCSLGERPGCDELGGIGKYFTALESQFHHLWPAIVCEHFRQKLNSRFRADSPASGRAPLLRPHMFTASLSPEAECSGSIHKFGLSGD